MDRLTYLWPNDITNVCNRTGLRLRDVGRILHSMAKVTARQISLSPPTYQKVGNGLTKCHIQGKYNYGWFKICMKDNAKRGWRIAAWKFAWGPSWIRESSAFTGPALPRVRNRAAESKMRRVVCKLRWSQNLPVITIQKEFKLKDQKQKEFSYLLNK